MSASDDRAARLSAERRELLDLWLGREDAAAPVPYVAPRTGPERALAAIWQDVLETDPVGTDDDYFQLGGDSILAIVVVARAQEAGLPLSTEDLFDMPTIGQLAAQLAQDSLAIGPDTEGPRPAAAGHGRPGERPDVRLPLTPMQAGMLFHALGDPSAYVVQVRCRLAGDVDAADLAAAWQAVVDRHPELRTSFQAGPDEPYQTAGPAVTVPVELMDWRASGAGTHDEALAQYLAEDRRRGFDPGVAPLLRVALIRLSATDYQFVLTHHHLLLDGWSQQLVLDELLAVYDAMGGAPPGPARPRPPFAAYLDWLGRQDLAAAEAFWRRQLSGYRPAPAGNQEDSGASGTVLLRSRLSPGTSARLAAFGRRHGYTLSTILQGAWALALAHLGGTDDIAFGVTMAGRPADVAGVTDALGLFINTLPARVRVPAGDDLLKWLSSVQRVQADLQRYQYTPLTLAERCSSARPGQRLFDSIVVVENFPVLVGEARTTRRLQITEATATVEEGYTLVLEARPGAEVQVALRYDRSRISADIAEALLAGVADFADQVAGSRPALVQDAQARVAGAMDRHSAAYRAGRRSALSHQLRSAQRQAVTGPATGAGP
jgi:aryl carrier-like protein